MSSVRSPFGFVALSALLLGACVQSTPGTSDCGTELPPVDAGTQPPVDSGTPVVDAGTPAVDIDLALVRFTANGTLDNTYGTNGVTRVDLSRAGSTTTRDSLWGITGDSQGRVLLFGTRKGDNRTDSDRAIARVTADGALDTSFADGGVYSFNLANLGDNARNGIVQADGKIISAGYTNQPTGVGAQTANRVILLRLNDNGTTDSTFGLSGVVNSNPFSPAQPVTTQWGMAEAYGVVAQDGKYVTTGYGRLAPSGQVNMVSFRYTAAGVLDTTWGTQGIVELDVAGDNDRGRNLAVLPDKRVAIVGSATPAANNVDAMVVLLTEDGKLDLTFNTTGYKLYSFDRPDEAFYGVAVSPSGNQLAAVGYRAGAVGGAPQDDDALLLVLPLGAGTEVAVPVELSATENDRFWGVAYDATGKIYAAGFVAEGGDNRMVVARFNADGTRDATFGNAGVATSNVAVGTTGEAARGVVVQADGKVVLGGTIEAPSQPGT